MGISAGGWAMVLSVLLVGTVWGEGNFRPKRVGQAELRMVGSIPVVTLAGNPEQLGRQHAALLAEPARELMQFPKRLFEEVDQAWMWPFAVSAGQTLLTHAPADHQAEFAAATTHEILDAGTLAVANTLLELRNIGCSTLVVEPKRSATGGLLFGRNFDFPPFGLLDRFGLVLVVRPDGKHAFAAVGYPGLLGVLSGMNDAGLCVATLDVYETADGSPGFDPRGSPMAFTFRQILEECTTVAEAEALLRRTPATTRTNLTVCDHTHGAVFEITPKQVVRRDSEAGLLPCTNHFRSPGLTSDEVCERYATLATAADEQVVDVEQLHAYLHQANQGEFTLQTMVFEPRELVLHLALGTPPTSAHALERLELGELLAPAAAK